MSFFSRKAQSLLAAGVVCAAPAFAQSSPVQLAALEPKADTRLLPETKRTLTPGAQEIAELLNIMPLVDQLGALHKSGSSENAELKELKLHVKLTDSILIAGLEVRDAAARIELELSRLDRFRGMLGEKRDRAIKYNSLANIFGGGVLNEIGQAGEMKTNEIPGEATELVGGGVVMLLSALAFHQQSGQKQKADLKPNMLSEVFGRPTNNDTQLSPLIWSYLNSQDPNSVKGRTRLDSLLQHWRSYRLIGNMKTVDGKKRVANLSNTAPRTMVDIDLCDDEMALLSDLRAEIYQIDRYLLELLLNLQKI
jgi:hypothetical protein